MLYYQNLKNTSKKKLILDNWLFWYMYKYGK